MHREKTNRYLKEVAKKMTQGSAESDLLVSYRHTTKPTLGISRAATVRYRNLSVGIV